MITNFLIILFMSIGLGGLLPSFDTSNRIELGLRLFGGFALITCLLYVGIVLLNLGVDTSLYLIIFFAFGGGVMLVRRIQIRAKIDDFSYHPIFLLPIAVVVIAFIQGPIHFTPVDDDTYMNWLLPAKQFWLFNGFDDQRLIGPTKGYLPGWHFLLGFTSPLWGSFSETRAIAVPAVLHIALLSATYDVLSAWARHNNLDKLWTRLFSHLTILLLLAAEASWVLVPTFILSEMPLFYTLIGIFIIGLLFFINTPRTFPLAFVMGLVLATHYSLKTQGLAAIPAAAAIGFIGTLHFHNWRPSAALKALGVSVIILLPTAIILLSWKELGPQSHRCMVNFGVSLEALFGRANESSEWKKLLLDVVDFIRSYLLTYKLPINLIASFGIIAALFDRKLRWLGLAVLGYIIVYLMAIYWAYFSCPDGFNSYLSSLQRYLQLPFRLLHFVGLWLLAMVGLKQAHHFLNGPKRPILIGAVLISIGLLSVCQFLTISDSFARIQSPEKGKNEKYAINIRLESTTLKEMVNAKNLDHPKVLLMYSFWEALPNFIAIHYGLQDSQNQVIGRISMSRWQLNHIRFDDKNSRRPVGMGFEKINSQDIVWPLDDTGPISKQIAKLTTNQECISHPSRYFLFRTKSGPDAFNCVLKSK